MKKMKNRHDQYVFLLGGHDLEMLEIRNLLNKYGLVYHDLNLIWGARLSSYSTVFNPDHAFVGIELEKDIDPPLHYIEIDHHNDKAHLPSSIEQVAGLINHKLTHYEQFVAANDKGYIPAMKALNASWDEIQEIRKADRAAQGVTDEDERLAEESIANNLKRMGDLICVESLTSKFSTITDRLYPCEKLLISYPEQFVYYGKGVAGLAEKFQNLVKNNKAFHGGGMEGFFGVPAGKMTLNEVEIMKSEIITTLTNL